MNVRYVLNKESSKSSLNSGIIFLYPKSDLLIWLNTLKRPNRVVNIEETIVHTEIVVGGKLKGKKGKLTMLRNLEHDQVKIKGTGFHSKAVRRYGTAQFIKAQYLKVSKRILKRKGIQ